MKKYDYTKELINKIIDLYVNKKLSTITIGKQLDIGEWSVRRCLQKNNIKLRPKFAFSRKYKLDESFFEKIDTEEKAYWLGFLYADGAVYYCKHGCYFHLTLQEKDEGMVEKFKENLKTNISLRIYSEKKQKGLMINSKKMVEDLIKLGCTPRKSFKITFPNFDCVPQYLMRHFIRGYFDGDGTVRFNVRRSRTEIKIISNIDFCKGMQNYLEKYCKISKFYKYRVFETKRKNEYYTNIGFGRTDCVMNFFKFIYENATIFLKRKKNIFDEYIKHRLLVNKNFKINYEQKSFS